MHRCHSQALLLADIHFVDCHQKLMMAFPGGRGQCFKWNIVLTGEIFSAETQKGVQTFKSFTISTQKSDNRVPARS